MNRPEVTAIMSAIKVAYPNYYKNQIEIEDAINLWAEMLSEDDAIYIAKSVKQFIKTDQKGFPPSIGQIRTLAVEIRRAEWDEKQRKTDLLPEPEAECIPMPDEIRRKMIEVFGRKP